MATFETYADVLTSDHPLALALAAFAWAFVLPHSRALEAFAMVGSVAAPLLVLLSSRIYAMAH